MEIEPVTDRGRTVAACNPNRVFFSDDLEVRAPDDPLRRLAEEMCQYVAESTKATISVQGHAQLEIGTPPAVVGVPTSDGTHSLAAGRSCR